MKQEYPMCIHMKCLKDKVFRNKNMKYSGIETTIIQVKAVAVTVKRGDQEENKQ